MLQPAEVRVRSLLEAVDVEVNGTRPFDPQVHDPTAFDRIVSGGTLAISETYMDGLWDCEQLDVLTAKVGTVEAPIKHLGRINLVKAAASTLLRNMQRVGQAAQNASHHYDIGNDLYKAMLGDTMAYSCAYWESYGGPLAKGADHLDTAQRAKFELICQKLKLEAGMRVLDIGCGWGGLLKHAVEVHGVKAVGITPAAEQVRHIRQSGLPIDVRQQDWRELDDGPFDRVVSVGMFEHVGPKNYRSYFERTRELLAQDGLALLHSIGAPKTRYMTDPWITKYIFPGGHIPSEAQIRRASSSSFTIADWHEMGRNYDPTLMAWHSNFENAWPELSQITKPDGEKAYDERFKRMWDFYLLTCAGSFRNRTNLLFQAVMGTDEATAGYEPVR